VNTVAIVQARMGSTRLPGKVLEDLCGETVLGRVIERVAACERIDDVVVATTDLSRDDAVAREAARRGAKVFRGSEEDVLGRYFGAATKFSAEVVVRVTADSPLFDPELLSEMLKRFFELQSRDTPVDYLSNTRTRSYPVGLGAEIFTCDALERAAREATDPYDREHVTPYLYREPGRFRVHAYVGEVDLSQHRWTLDTPEDLRFVRAVYSTLTDAGTDVTTQSVLDLLRAHPELAALNAHVQQRAEPGRA
jgi:spore coat polysaccharide biosynthesis protein SpsF